MTSFDTDQRNQNDRTNDPPFRPGLLVFFSVLSLVTLAAGGLLTSLGLGPWYRDLQIPWFQPPAWAFTPAWLIIFVLLAIATWRISRRGSIAGFALGLYGLQLVANALWSFFFFPMERPDLALIDIFALDAMVIGMTVLYGRIDRTSGLLLLPYVVWLGLATAINVWIVLYN